MKKLLFLLVLSLGIVMHAQKLNSIYMNGLVKLIPDSEYGKLNDWNKLFDLYNDTLNNDWKQSTKAIIVAPDGSVFMSHRNRYVIWKFRPDGTFEKRFGGKGSKPGQFIMMPRVGCVIDSKYILTTDVGGHLNIFDLNCNYVKTINLKYTANDFLPVGNSNVMLLGFAVWKKQSRDMVVNLNIDNGSETIIHDFFTDYPKMDGQPANADSIIKAAKGHYNLRVPAFGTGNNTQLMLLPDGKFIRTDRKTAEYTLYSQNGSELVKAKMEIDPVKISQEDVEQNYKILKKTFTENVARYKKMLDPNSPTRTRNPDWSPVATERYLKNAQAWLDNLDLFRELSNYYPYFPVYSNIMVDDEGNLLVFEYTSISDKATNRFNVIAYSSNGKRLARTSFVCDDYDLTLSGSSFVFSKGYVYAVAKLKNAAGMPLRLVKFKMTN